MQNDSQSKVLLVHEWLAVIVFLAIICFVILITFFTHRQHHFLLTDENINREISVTITGAVVKTKSMVLEKGVLLKDVLRDVTLLSDADLDRLDIHQVLKEDLVISIPVKETVTVFVEGDVVRKGAYILKRGSTRLDLLKMVEVIGGKDQVNLKPLTKKLIHEEVIKIHQML